MFTTVSFRSSCEASIFSRVSNIKCPVTSCQFPVSSSRSTPVAFHWQRLLVTGHWLLKFQPCFACRLGHRANPPVIEVAAAIEHDARDAFFLQPIGDCLAERLRADDVAAAGRAAERALQRRLRARRRRDCRPAHVVDHLRVDMRDASEHAETRPLGSPADALALPQRDPNTAVLSRSYLHRQSQSPIRSIANALDNRQSPMIFNRQSAIGSLQLLGSRLPRLLLQHFPGVADALLLVGIRLAERANIGRDLTHQLPVDPRDGYVRLLVDRHVDPGRDVEHHGMRVAECEVHLLAPDLGAVPDTDDIEIFTKALGDAADGVRDQAARQTVELPQFGAFVKGLCLEVIAVHLEADAPRQHLPQLAFRTLDLDGVRLHVDFDALRNRDDLFPNARHKSVSSRQFQSPFSSSPLPAVVTGNWRAATGHHTLQSTSPPTPAFTASRPVMTPREVVRMLVPRPASTSGTSSRPKYTRRPGRLTRWIPVITRSPRGPYFRTIRSVGCGSPFCGSTTFELWM